MGLGMTGKRKRSAESSSLAWVQKDLKSKVDKLHETWQSPKFIIMAHILAMASIQDEKTLIYSKCLKTLDLVESFLESDWKKEVSSLVEHFEHTKLGRLEKNQHFLRIDGSTDSGKRGSLVDKFNEDSQVKAFLISSIAGGIGINLVRLLDDDHRCAPLQHIH